MNRKLFPIGLGWLLSLFIITHLAPAQTGQEEVVSFPDANLDAAVRSALRLPAGEPITARTMLNLSSLYAVESGITDLTGLEYATNLGFLSLNNDYWRDDKLTNHNTVSDLSPLATLTRLGNLYLDGNPISDITPLANLTQLTDLRLSFTNVSDITPLANLTQLTVLRLDLTNVSDITPLANLTQLTELTLGNTPISDITPLANLTQLQTLYLGSNPISDITPLANLTQLTELRLPFTNVSDIMPLANLTQLTVLSLGSTPISDISPLANLIQLTDLALSGTNVSDISPLANLTLLRVLEIEYTNVSDISVLTALTQLIELNIQRCPLPATAYSTHIPTIDANGAIVRFDPLKQAILPQVPGLVSLIYFRPNDRPVLPNIDAKIDQNIKKAQRFYADEMEHHGFGRKTFQFEMDESGNAVVHHVIGKFDAAHYHSNPTGKWWNEIYELVHIPKGNIAVCVIDTAGVNLRSCGIAGGDDNGGLAHIYCLDWITFAHELGHAFGMVWHDFRSGSYIMSYGYYNELSECAAKWLDVHRAFNTNPPNVGGSEAKIVMHPPSSDSSFPNAIRFRFEVTNGSGLHQAMLITEEISLKGGLLSCQRLHGEKSSIVEFVTTGVTPERKWVVLSVIDVRGNISWKRFPIDVSSILLPPEPVEVVSFPDPNLGKVVREALLLTSDEEITVRTMLWLRQLEARDRGITDLTGLEHAKKLRRLNLAGKYVSGEGYVNSNAVLDFSPLEKLTQLKSLNLSYMQGLDVSSLVLLTQLEELDLGGTDILDISPLTALTQLRSLNLSNTTLSDVSMISALTQLKSLNLSNTTLSDVSSLAVFTQLEYLNLRNTAISDVSPLTALTQLEYLNLRWNFIWDTFPLTELPQLKGSRDWHGLYLEGNPLSYAAVSVHIPALQAKGVKVRFENRVHSALVRVSGNRQEGDSGETLQTALTVKAQDAHWKPMSEVAVKFSVVQGEGTLSNYTATTDANGIAETILMLGRNKGLNRIRATAAGITYPVIFTATVTEPLTQLAAAAPPAPLIALQPEETTLLPNYPNPFNPETWIPYELAVPANVTLTIYASNGAAVRTLALGPQEAGIYRSKNRAAYWDGRNHIGEKVASGVYFYTFSAGEFTATRKLLIRK